MSDVRGGTVPSGTHTAPFFSFRLRLCRLEISVSRLSPFYGGTPNLAQVRLAGFSDQVSLAALRGSTRSALFIMDGVLVHKHKMDYEPAPIFISPVVGC